MSDQNPNNQNSEKKPELQKKSAPKTPLKKMSLADLMGDDDIQKFLEETEESEQKKESEPEIEIRPTPVKKSGGQQPAKKQSKKLDNKDVLGAISQLSKLSGGDTDSVENEEITEESDEELKKYIDQLDESDKGASTFSDLRISDELYSFEQPDISLPISPTELDESDLEKEKRDLEKDLEKKIKTVSEPTEEEIKSKLSIFGMKKRAIPIKMQPKMIRRTGIAFICLILLVPTILLIPSYETNYARQLLSSPYLGFMVWKEEVDSRVDPKFIPAFAEKFVNPTIDLVMAKGETEYLKFVIRSLFSTPTQGRITLSDFINSENTTSINAQNFVILKELKDDERVFYPDKLEIQTQEFELAPNTNYVMYIKYQSPINATAGLFSGTMMLRLGNSQFIVKINIKILDSEIANHKKTIFYSGNQITSITDIQSLISLKISTMKIDFDYEYNATTNSFTFNWTQFDLLMNSAMSQGLENVDISFRWNPPSDIIQFSARYNASLNDSYTKIWNHMVGNGWQNYTLVDLGIKYTDAQINTAVKMISLIKSVSPEIRVLCGAALSVDSIRLLKDVDVWALSQIDLQNQPQFVNNLLANGKKILLAIEPQTQLPYMNLKLTNPLIHARLIPWLVFQFNLDGIYLYNTSDARVNAYGYGDDGLLTGLLLYRNEGRIIPSIRWLIFSQGLEDLSYLVKTKQIAQQNQDSEPGKKALTIINQLNMLMKSYTEFSISSSHYSDLRLQMSEILT